MALKFIDININFPLFSDGSKKTENDCEKIESIIVDALDELMDADTKHPRMNGCREGLEVLRCEVQELNSELAKTDLNMDNVRAEAIQVLAMAIKFIRDTCQD